MEIADTSKLSFDPVSLKHRGSGLYFKTLFLGDQGDPANNYYFMLARQRSFYSPVHRHNFDQFRYSTLGDISILPNVNVRQGELCYHPEGVYYGPQDDGDQLKEVLVLQFGGASGQGFISHEKLAESQKRLDGQGRFEGGKFFRAVKGDEGSNIGEDEAIDAYQALWEDQMRRPLVYPEGRYDRVIKMQPDAYTWSKVKGCNGVWKKTLGVFSERETRAEILKIESSTCHIMMEDATQLFYVLKGEGLTGGEKIVAEWAGRIQAGKAANISTTTELQVLRFVMPTLSQA
ncbi:hypothetical protein N7478_009231 [Penicillium angulare]|uniref:uncharacterized protein n=1 Tax=Penicillium angulare TaxID=116970 RepID=UPI002540B96E|nr:uncharacterized protein N7478_009231 [Penicillium angulare]KAJ5274106.1 hypothetical protein N7478_009231 [Penicillium angulare]